MAWLKNLFSVLNSLNGQPVPQRVRQDWRGAVTVTDDPVGDQTVFQVGTGQDASFGALTAQTLAVGGLTLQQEPTVTTSAGETKNLLQTALTIPEGKTVIVRVIVKATVYTGTQIAPYILDAFGVYSTAGGVTSTEEAIIENAGSLIDSPPFGGSIPTVSVAGTANAGGIVRLTCNTVGMSTHPIVLVSSVGGTVEANGTWEGSVHSTTELDLPAVAFSHAYTSGGQVQVLGSSGLVLSGSALQVQATGLVAPAYRNNDPVLAFALRSNANGVYMVTRTGNGTTSAVGTGPSGTGSNIADGGAHFAYVGAGTGVPVTWQVVRLEIL